MPRDIPTYTVCAEPGIARSHKQLGGLAGFLVNAFLNNRLFTVGALLLYLIALIILGSPAGWVFTALGFIIALTEFKHWYYNERLLCIRDRDCAIGTVISEPLPAFDGDRKLNLMLAPYGQRNLVETLLDHIETNETMLDTDANFNDPPFHTTAPDFDISNLRNDFDALRAYLERLHSEDSSNPDAEANMFSQLLIGVVDRLMSNASRNFYNRFSRKDPAHIPDGSALWNAIPQDFDPTVNWQEPNARSTLPPHPNPYEQPRQEILNPMFRYDIPHLVPYMHCEIEGYYIQLLIDNVIIALWAWILALIAFWLLVGPFAPLVALVIALIVWIFKLLIDELTGNDGRPDEPDIDWDDIDVPDPEDEPERVGDVVVAYGNWIMDTEHYQFFEIHPIRAYYIIARNSTGRAELVNGNLEQEEFGHENFDPTQITAERADVICGIVTQGEEEDPPPIIERTGPTALSYGMQTRYAGAQQQTIE